MKEKYPQQTLLDVSSFFFFYCILGEVIWFLFAVNHQRTAVNLQLCINAVHIGM